MTLYELSIIQMQQAVNTAALLLARRENLKRLNELTDYINQMCGLIKSEWDLELLLGELDEEG